MERNVNIAMDALAAAGDAASETHRVIRYDTEWTPQGTLLISGKVADRFNFVGRAALTLTADGSTVTALRCDCRKARESSDICVHCAVLAAYAASPVNEPSAETAEAVPVIPVPEPPAPAPEPITEPEPIPEPEPIAEPELIAEPEPCAEPEPTPEPEPCAEPQTMRILFGTELSTGESVYWEPNNTEQVLHTNTGIIGTMGTGKTQFTKSLIAQLYRGQSRNFDGRPLGMLIFDYKGDYNENAADFVSAVQAHVIKPYRIPYNPFALNRTKSFRPLLPLHTANQFKDTLSKIYPSLGPKQQQTLLDAILAAYAQQGIAPENPLTWNRPAPTFAQVYAQFEKATEGKTPDSLFAAMSKLHQFCIFEPDPMRTSSLSDLLDGVVVVDLSGYSQDIQNLIVAITLDQFYAQMYAHGSSATNGTLRQLRQFILVDEADNFMGEDFESLRRIMKEGREFGVGMILSTQSLRHFVGGDDDYSRYILTWVVHNVNDLHQREVERMMRMEARSQGVSEICDTVRTLRKHESVVRFADQDPLVIKDKAFWQLMSESLQE